jgi:protein-arginine kinase activator protein McsA
MIDNIEICPACNCKVKSSNLKKHLKKTHLDYLLKQNLPKKSSTTKFTKLMYRCNQCKRTFGKAATAKHLREKHDFTPHFTDEIHTYYFTQIETEVTRVSTPNLHPKLKQSPTAQKLAADSNNYRSITTKKNSKTIHCSICKCDMNYKKTRNHFSRVHDWDIEKSKKLENEPDLKEETNPNDYFNAFRVFSAGAYGLGKNRKN